MPRSRTILHLAYVFGLFTATPLVAHPMGNFSVNHYSRIWIGTDSVQVRYVVDLAEIPTFQELQARNIKADLSGPDLSAYLEVKAEEFGRGIKLTIDGRPVKLACGERQLIFPPGAGGLPTMKFGFTCNVPLSRVNSGQHRLQYRDENFAGRAGWKELIVHGDPASHLVSDADREDRSGELSNYPTDLLNSPPQDLAANLSFTTGVVPNARQLGIRASIAAKNTQVGERKLHPLPQIKPATPQFHPDTGRSKLKANAQLTPRSTFTELIGQQRLSLWFLLTAAMISMALGALHALEPGHGKTLVAAYLVGSRGTATHAVLLGLIVTLAHTAGVYVLGAITLYASRYVLPERLYPWLGAVSGAIIALLGVLLFIRRWAAADSLLGEGHTHWYDRFAGVNLDDKQSDASATNVAQQVSIRQLLVLGIVGGLVPCPAALVVLLSALALHRIIFGFFLILSFSFGLAAVLIGIGLLIVHAAKSVSGLNADTQLIRRRLPLLSAAAITLVGLSLVVQSIKNDAVVTQLNAVVGAKWLLVGGIGLLLGMRHSTDADHVIAVTTIVTRLRSVRHAGVVGMLWGIGHTLTIFIIGSAIILFGIVIPPRIGLSLEFAVALMLVLLGVLNLAGVLARLARRFSTTNLPDQPSLVIAHEGAEWAGAASIATKLGTYQLLKPLVIGVVHGLAGSAAVALMVLATIHEPVWAIAYLLLFGLGTIAGMMLMTAIIAFPIVWTGNGFAHWNRLMTATSGIVSVAFGLFLIYRIGFISGLFSSGPKWMPG